MFNISLLLDLDTARQKAAEGTLVFPTLLHTYLCNYPFPYYSINVIKIFNLSCLPIYDMAYRGYVTVTRK